MSWVSTARHVPSRVSAPQAIKYFAKNTCISLMNQSHWGGSIWHYTHDTHSQRSRESIAHVSDLRFWWGGWGQALKKNGRCNKKLPIFFRLTLKALIESNNCQLLLNGSFPKKACIKFDLNGMDQLHDATAISTAAFVSICLNAPILPSKLC